MILSDAKIKTLITQRTKLKEQIDKLDRERAKIDLKVLPELERRDVRVIEFQDGVKVRRKFRTITDTNVPAFLDHIERTRKPKRAARIVDLVTKRVMNKEGIAEAVANGEIEMEELDMYTTVTESSPWLEVN